MTPSPIDPASLPEALAQLKTLLDQGIITAAEYAILKHRLLTTPAPAAPGAPPTPAAAPNALPGAAAARPSAATPVAPPTAAAPPPPAQELPSLLDMFQQAPGSLTAAPAPAPVPMRPVAPAPTPVVPAPVAAAVEFLPVPTAPPARVAATPAALDFLPPPAPAPTPPPTPPPPPRSPLASAPTFSEPELASPSRPAEPLAPAAASRPAPALPDALARVEARLAEPAPVADRPAPAAAAGRSARRTLPTVLAVLVGLALVLELGYLVLGRNQPNEHLTSRSKTAADSVAVRPEVGPQDAQVTLPPSPEPEVVRTAPLVLPTTTAADSAATAATVEAARRKAAAAAEDAPVFPSVPPTTTTPAPASSSAGRSSAAALPAAAPAETPASGAAPASVPAPPVSIEPAAPATAPEDGDDEATTRTRQALASYYADLQAPPFNASQHFAPAVERLYTRQNLTPATIETELSQSMFPEFKELNTRVVPGTLRVGPPAADGTRTATYTEQSRAFRVSKGQHQRTRTQVRVRFNPDYKITYMRQEKLLENTFEQ